MNASVTRPIGRQRAKEETVAENAWKMRLREANQSWFKKKPVL